MSYYFLEPPIPLVSTAEPPQFPLEALPTSLQEYVRQISHALQVHPDMPSALSLAILAACVQGKTKISVTPEWQEELSLYTAVIAEPGERKSAVFSALTSPIYSYTENYNLTHAAEIAAYQNNVKRLEVRKNKLISDNAAEEEINEVQSELSLLLANPVVPMRLDEKERTFTKRLATKEREITADYENRLREKDGIIKSLNSTVDNLRSAVAKAYKVICNICRISFDNFST